MFIQIHSFSRVCGLVLACGLALSAHGQANQPRSIDPVPPNLAAGRENAALAYYRAWELLSREDSKLVGENFTNEKGWFPNEEVTSVLVSNQRVIEQLLRASEIPECDWGIRYEDGIHTLLPHLGRLRQTVRWFVADARRLVRDGDISGAARRIAGGVRICNQTRFDRYLISTLVGAAVQSLCAGATDNLFAEGVMTPEAARIIHTAFKTLDADALFHGDAWIRTEEWMSTEWTKQQYKGPNAGAEFMRLFDELAIDPVKSDPSFVPLRTMTQEQLHAEIDRMKPFYAEARGVWNLPDAMKQLEKLHENVQSGQYGLVARGLVPSLTKSKSALDKASAMTRKTLKDLELFLAEGKVPLDANPASKK